GVRRFTDGGYTVFRWAQAGTDCLAAFDHGPLGHLSIAAHGHADALALWLHVGGQPVLIDAGTFLYHSGGDWRSTFRGTPAHNTLSIAGEDSSRIAGPFNWSDKAAAALLGAVEGPDLWSAEAEHDGFLRRHGARHRRRLERRGNRLIVTDRLLGNARPLPVEIGFLIHPDLTVTPTDAGWAIADAARVLAVITGGAPLTATLERGATNPRRGWCSPAFGARMPAPRLTLRGALGPDDASRVTITVLPE
ncbi:MAG TPA: heparinase II/III-family protein, partial [Azospirillum sp.]